MSNGNKKKILVEANVRNKKMIRKVQEEPQAEAAANTLHQEEEKKWHKLTCA